MSSAVFVPYPGRRGEGWVGEVKDKVFHPSRDFLFKCVTPWHLRIGKRRPNAIKNSLK